ncbi:MAG: hypothetical protein WAX69_21260 [Victivallales bacterium]
MKKFSESQLLNTKLLRLLCVLSISVLTLLSITGCDPNEKPVVVRFDAPTDGHVSIAINNAEGRRVRNLVADLDVKKGPQEVKWDGRADDGSLVPTGEYKWIGLIRGKLDVLYRGTWQEGNPPWQYGRTGGWLSDHYPPCAVVCLEDRVLVGAGVSEWGRGLSCVDMDGKVIWAEHWLTGLAWNGAACLKTDGERVFAMGFPNWVPGFHTIVEINPKTGAMWPVVRIPNPPKPGETAAVIPPQWVIKDKDDERLKDVKGLRLVGMHRKGATRWDGELYTSDILGDVPRTFVYSTARAPEANSDSGYYHGNSKRHYTMSLLRVLPLKIWDMAWLPDGRCLAVLDKSVAILDTQTGATTPFIERGLEAPFAIAVDAKGRIYVSDRGGREQLPPTPACTLPHLGMRLSDTSSQQVKIFDTSGKLLRAMGHQGGRRFGSIDPRDFYLPAGLGIDKKGRLWVTEEYYPKRVSVWEIPDDVAGKEPILAREFFSSAEYGEAGYMPDPKEPRKIISESRGILWDVDIAKGTFHPLKLFPRIHGPARSGSMSYDPDLPFPLPLWVGRVDAMTEFISFQNRISVDGRSFAWASGAAVTVIGEDSVQSFKPLAAFGRVGNYIRESGHYGSQWVPKAILDAAKQHPKWAELVKREKFDPAMSDLPHDPKLLKWPKEIWPKEIDAFNWTDANGDGKMQANEIVLSPLLPQSGGAVVTFDKKLDAMVVVGGNLWKMRHQGMNSAGAPVYDWSKAEPMFNTGVGAPSFIGGNAELLVTPREGNYNGAISFIGADGHLLWSYPTLASGHGHRRVPNIKEKVMEPGVIYGGWNMQGVADLPDSSGRFFLLHGGHGMDYLMTLEDGLFIGTVFKPLSPWWDGIPEAKKGMSLNDYSLHDECFNGSLVRVERSDGGFEAGHYYLLGLGRSAVVELTGLDSVKRLPGGTVKITGKMVAAALSAELLADQERWNRKRAGTCFDIARNDGGLNLNLPSTVNLGRIAHDGMDARVSIWHNLKGLGVGFRFGRPYGGALASIFLNDAPSWEQVILYGDAIEVDVAAELPDGVAAADQQRIVFARWHGAPVAIKYRKVKLEAVPPGAKVLQDKPSNDGRVWIAERFDVPADGFKIEPSIYYNDSASILYLIPWQKLGFTYSEGMKLRMNIVQNRRKSAGGGVMRSAWTSDGTDCVTDMLSALERPASLWRPCALRPRDYVFPPPAPDKDDEVAKKESFTIAAKGNPANKPVQFADATVWLNSTPEALEMKWYVIKDSSPFVNNGKDGTLLFKTGDACDLQIESPKLGKCRYLVTICDGKPVVVRYRYDAKDPGQGEGVWYRSPAGELFVPSVERLSIEPKIQRGDTWYTVELAIPWATLGIEPKPGTKIKFELGILRSDTEGSKTMTRDYWHSGLSGMTADVPTEARPTDNWGEAVVK